jgi:hypothetical protein
MDSSSYRYLGTTITELTGTAGTVNLGHCQAVDIQAVMDANTSYEIAILPTQLSTATASKSNCAAVISDNGNTGRIHLPPGAVTKYYAYKVYNGTAVASGTSAFNKLIATKLG